MCHGQRKNILAMYKRPLDGIFVVKSFLIKSIYIGALMLNARIELYRSAIL